MPTVDQGVVGPAGAPDASRTFEGLGMLELPRRGLFRRTQEDRRRLPVRGGRRIVVRQDPIVVRPRGRRGTPLGQGPGEHQKPRHTAQKKAAAKDAQVYDKTLPDGLSDIDGTLVKRYGEALAEDRAVGADAPARADDSTGKNRERRTLKPEDISVRVLNESGINGAGAATAEILKKKGFRVSEVGNGSASSREKTVFSVPERAVDLFYGMPFDCLITANDESTLAVLRIGKDYR